MSCDVKRHGRSPAPARPRAHMRGLPGPAPVCVCLPSRWWCAARVRRSCWPWPMPWWRSGWGCQPTWCALRTARCRASHRVRPRAQTVCKLAPTSHNAPRHWRGRRPLPRGGGGRPAPPPGPGGARAGRGGGRRPLHLPPPPPPRPGRQVHWYSPAVCLLLRQPTSACHPVPCRRPSGIARPAARDCPAAGGAHHCGPTGAQHMAGGAVCWCRAARSAGRLPGNASCCCNSLAVAWCGPPSAGAAGCSHASHVCPSPRVLQCLWM